MSCLSRTSPLPWTHPHIVLISSSHRFSNLLSLTSVLHLKVLDPPLQASLSARPWCFAAPSAALPPAAAALRSAAAPREAAAQAAERVGLPKGGQSVRVAPRSCGKGNKEKNHPAGNERTRQSCDWVQTTMTSIIYDI